MKQKICKKGINKALGFEGCGKETFKLQYGLCPKCLYDFYTTDERGKILYQKSFLPKVSLKLKSFDKAKTKQMKENVKKLSDYEAEAKKAFQKWIRLRDKDLPCISCNRTDDVIYAGGHYFKAEVYSGLIFDERNVHKQCNAYCNKFRDGAQAEYRIGLVNRYGKEYVEQLEAESVNKRVYKFTKQELIDIKKFYSEKIKAIERTNNR